MDSIFKLEDKGGMEGLLFSYPHFTDSTKFALFTHFIHYSFISSSLFFRETERIESEFIKKITSSLQELIKFLKNEDDLVAEGDTGPCMEYFLKERIVAKLCQYAIADVSMIFFFFYALR